MTAADLKIGESGEIKQFKDERTAVKLLEMGLLPGVRVLLVRTAPFKGALYLKVSNAVLALGKEEANNIILA